MSRRGYKMLLINSFLNSYNEYREMMKELKKIEIGSSPKNYGMVIQGKHKKLKPRSKGNCKNVKNKK